MLLALKNIFISYIETTGKAQALVVLFIAILSSLIATLEPLIFTKIISYIEVYYQTWEFNQKEVVQLIIFWWLFILFTIIVSFVFRYFFLYKVNMKNYVLNCKKFNKRLVFMWYGEYIGKKQGSLYKIYDRGTQGQESFLYFFIWEAIKNISSIMLIIVILFLIDIKMALLTLSMLPVMLFMWVYFVRRLSVTQKELNDKWDMMFWDIWNILSSFQLTKLLGIEMLYLTKMSDRLDNLLYKQNKLGKWWSIVHIYTAFLVMISRILVLGFWFYYVVNGTLSLAELFLFFSFIGWIYFPLAALIDRFNEVVRHLTSVEKMYLEFADIEGENIDIWKSVKNLYGSITFHNVSFGYSDEKKILKNINFEIKKWQKIALVGNTGAGKSTIVNLLLRFWDVTDGEILLDGVNINTLKKSSLRSHIGVVSQDNSLFNLSIEENLKFANPRATQKEIEEALRQAQADFVFSLPNWLQTIIGERWLKLSGWEKQRISIARLFLKNPQILILDEATSALDNTTEKQIDIALKKLMKGKTSIIVAHRLSTIRYADTILVLENGKVVESGNYDELIGRSWKFAALANPDKLIMW